MPTSSKARPTPRSIPSASTWRRHTASSCNSRPIHATTCSSATGLLLLPVAGVFQLFDGTSGWDLFFGNTKPAVVMQLDTSNCRDGGADPVAVLKKYPGRARTIHIKASGGGPDAVIGEGADSGL